MPLQTAVDLIRAATHEDILRLRNIARACARKRQDAQVYDDDADDDDEDAQLTKTECSPWWQLEPSPPHTGLTRSPQILSEAASRLLLSTRRRAP